MLLKSLLIFKDSIKCWIVKDSKVLDINTKSIEKSSHLTIDFESSILVSCSLLPLVLHKNLDQNISLISTLFFQIEPSPSTCFSFSLA